jgi:hypothetical protein
VRQLGLGVVAVADWFSQPALDQAAFFDDNTRSDWVAATGGANVPALNDLLAPFGVAFSDRVFDGAWTVGGGSQSQVTVLGGCGEGHLEVPAVGRRGLGGGRAPAAQATHENGSLCLCFFRLLAYLNGSFVRARLRSRCLAFLVRLHFIVFVFFCGREVGFMSGVGLATWPATGYLRAAKAGELKERDLKNLRGSAPKGKDRNRKAPAAATTTTTTTPPPPPPQYSRAPPHILGALDSCATPTGCAGAGPGGLQGGGGKVVVYGDSSCMDAWETGSPLCADLLGAMVAYAARGERSRAVFRDDDLRVNSRAARGSVRGDCLWKVLFGFSCFLCVEQLRAFDSSSISPIKSAL